MRRLITFATTALFIFLFGACSDRMPVASEASAHTTSSTTSSESSPEPNTDPAEDDEDSELPVLDPENHDIYPIPGSGGVSGGESDDSDSADDETGLTGVVNLNEATREELMRLPGVGPTIAGRIAEYREKRRFEKPGHLTRVRGIGEVTLRKLRAHLAVDGETTISE